MFLNRGMCCGLRSFVASFSVDVDGGSWGGNVFVIALRLERILIL